MYSTFLAEMLSSPRFLLFSSRSLNATYLEPLLVYKLKSPNFIFRCSSCPLIPICMSQIVLWSDSGLLSPSCPLSHSSSKSWPARGSAAFCLFPFPLFFRFFLAALIVSLEDENSGSRRMLYGFFRSSRRCLSIFRWKEVSESGPYSVPSTSRILTKKWRRSRSSSS